MNFTHKRVATLVPRAAACSPVSTQENQMCSSRVILLPIRQFSRSFCFPQSFTIARSLQLRKMSLMQRNPAGGFPSLTRALNDLESFLSRPTGGNEVLGHCPRFDVRETKDSYRLDGDLPGVDKKNVEVEFSDDNTLTIKGHSERESTSENPEQSWWYSERSVGDFRRSFTFPHPVDREHIDATLKDGVLSINVPKAGDATINKRIDVK
ncbi:hypothetical protein HCH54_005241 [Aspergillus fumigatus]